MKRSATWRWGRIAGIALLAAIALVTTNSILGPNVWWSFASGVVLWFAAYSAGRQSQTEALGIRMIEFVKDHHAEDPK